MAWGGIVGDQAGDLVPLNGTLKTIKHGISRGQYRISITSTDHIEQILRLHVLVPGVRTARIPANLYVRWRWDLRFKRDVIMVEAEPDPGTNLAPIEPGC